MYRKIHRFVKDNGFIDFEGLERARESVFNASAATFYKGLIVGLLGGKLDWTYGRMIDKHLLDDEDMVDPDEMYIFAK